MSKTDFKSSIDMIFSLGLLKKAVFSRSLQGMLRANMKPLLKGGERIYQLELFSSDGKAYHRNMTADEAIAYCLDALSCWRQMNFITSGGDLEVLVSKKGELHLTGKITPARAADAGAHNREKNYILNPKEHASFLSPLGVCDEKGNIIEKKRSKFRQIERFCELVDDVYSSFPSEGALGICDLCCGKSYLTFALYYYLTAIKGREVIMYGVDLKGDVIEFCKELSEKLGFAGLHFVCANASEFSPKVRVDAVVSLHACDIATDFVLDFAIRHKSPLIFSTPCCHHEMMHTISCPELDFITRYPMMKQKLCDAATDSLRALMLEANGYSVEAVELIDPEDTPKNIMLRAKYLGISNAKMEKKTEEYKRICAFLGVEPMLKKLRGI